MIQSGYTCVLTSLNFGVMQTTQTIFFPWAPSAFDKDPLKKTNDTVNGLCRALVRSSGVFWEHSGLPIMPDGV